MGAVAKLGRSGLEIDAFNSSCKTMKTASSHGGSGPHILVLGPPESIIQTASRLVQPFLHSSQLMAECRRVCPGMTFPLKLSLCMGVWISI